MTASREETLRFIAMAAMAISDGDVCFVGIGVPSLAAMAAKRHHAPRAVLVYESGAIDADPPSPPLSMGSPAVTAQTAMTTSCLGVFSMLQQGRIQKGLLSAAQVDRLGNLNSTQLARPGKTPLRLVGSGGAHDIAVLVPELLILMPHDPRRFVPKVDHVTSPGLRPANSMRGGGPAAVITPRARFDFSAGELTLDALPDGVDEAEATAGIAWAVRRRRPLRRLPPPDRALLATAERLLEAWGRDAA
jgi:glutaconate CoA-transferase subunit B